MSEPDRRAGSIAWFDLTTENAALVREFYQEVVGWKSSEVEMGDYSDFGMHRPSDDEMVAGVCHARGSNVGIPPVWLPYVNVDDLDASLSTCRSKGGTVVVDSRGMGGESKMAVIQDPSGAFLALYQQE